MAQIQQYNPWLGLNQPKQPAPYTPSWVSPTGNAQLAAVPPYQLTPEEEAVLSGAAPAPAVAPMQKKSVSQPPPPAADMSIPKANPNPVPEEDMYQQLINTQSAGLAQQQAGVEELDAEIKRQLANRQVGIDLSPAMAFADRWVGGNTAGAYRKPQTAEDLSRELIGYKEKLQAAKGGVTDKEMDLLRTKLNAQTQVQLAKERAEDRKLQKQQMDSFKTEREIQRQTEFFEKDAEKDSTKAKEMTTALTTLESAVDEFIANPSVTSRDYLKQVYARTVVPIKNDAGLGALAGPDINIVDNILGNPASVEKMAKEGLGADAYKSIKRSFSEMRNHSSKTLEDRYGAYVTKYPQARKDIKEFYKKSYVDPVKQMAKGKEMASGQPSLEDLKAKQLQLKAKMGRT